MNNIDISIVIPVYFNEGSIEHLYNVLNDEVFGRFPNNQFEIIFVDDGSLDNSYKEMVNIKKRDDSVKLIRFTRNFGQVAALYAGYKIAKGNGVLNIGADLQEPSELIINMIDDYLKKTASIIIGTRIKRDESFYRKITSQIFYSIMQKLSFPKMPIGGFDVILMDEKVKEYILNLNESNPFLQGQILWSGYSIKFIPYNRLKRNIGKSKWSFAKKIKYLLDGILNYSYLPLRLFSLLGILSFFGGIIYSTILVIFYFLGYAPFKGWTPIMIIILLFSGLQLIMLGLIGEYLWRSFEQTKKRPQYIIDESN